MEELVSIKKDLKKWESTFIDVNKRKPGKSDIDKAPQDIKDAYQKYKELKQQNTNHDEKGKESSKKESNSEHEAGTDTEAWGHEFDRKNVKTETVKMVTQNKQMKSSFLDNIGKKMFEKSLKLNIHQANVKDSNQWRKPDTPRRGIGPSLVFSTPDLNEEQKNTSFNDSFKDSTDAFQDESSDNTKNTDLPVFQSQKFSKLLDKSVYGTKNTESDQNIEESTPCLTKFQRTMKSNASVFSKNLSKIVTKHKVKHNISWTENCGDDDNVDRMEVDVDNSRQTDEVDGDTADMGGHSWHVPVKDLIVEDMVQYDKMSKSKSKYSKTSQMVENKNERSKKQSTAKETENVDNERHDQTVDQAESNTSSKTTSIKSLTFINEMDSEQSVLHESGDGEEGTKNVRESNLNKSGKKITRKRKPNVIESDDEDYNTMTGEVQEMETTETSTASKGNGKGKATVTKRPAKRKKLNTGESRSVNPGGDVESSVGNSAIANKPVAKKPTRTKPVSNDNFLRLNMKVKTYKRKGRHMTGGQYKRQMWKQKMKDRSKSYGDACFKCGQPGHWANKCPGNKSQSSGNKEPVLDEDFPSMQEAAMMARGIRLEREQKQPKTTQKTETAPSTSKAPVMRNKVSTDDTVQSIQMEKVNSPSDDSDTELEIQSEIVRTRKEREPVHTAMEPLLDMDHDVNEVPDFVQRGLKKFGYDNFRLGQRQAVMRILKGQSTLVVLSTGGGKSLCYQLPAYLYAQRTSCITLVISPLVSLMEDQVTGLPNGIIGMCLHTNMTPSQREKVLTAVKDGKAQFLLVSPEAIAGGSMTLITSMASLPPVAFVCIDEAHCLSEWSHNFRPSYLRLCKVLRDKLGIQCFLGLTATATLSTAADVSRHLNITDFKTATVRGSPIPPNLQLSVSRDDSREQALVNLLQGDRFCNLDSIIVYCTRRDQTDKVATMIRTCLNKGAPLEAKKFRKRIKLEWDAESYHAGLSPAQRKRVQNNFMSGKLRVVVATVAFGMGLDKADVRGIIHYNMPKSFESYVQEIGRAGRDGDLAQCHVFLDGEGKDLCELKRHTHANTVDYKVLKKLVSKIFSSCRCREVHEKHAEAEQEVTKVFDPAEGIEDEFDDQDADLIEACLDNEAIRELEKQGTTSHGTLPQSKLSPDNSSPATGIQRDMTSDVKDTAEGQIVDYEKSNSASNSGHTVDNDTTQTDKDTGHVKSSTGDTNQPEHDQDATDCTPDNADKPIDDCDTPTANAGDGYREEGVTIATGLPCKARLCPGHERALPIEQTVMELDVKEEGISTLLCYLELHANQWLENLPSVYANCKIQCYEGPGQLQAVAKKCPPVAVAIAKARKEGRKFTNTNVIEFPVVETSDCMGWDSGPVKKELKLLQWDFTSGTTPRRTGVMIEFTDLAYHFRSPGDFSSSELDDILEFLHARVQRQEKSELYNLSKLNKSLKSVSHKNYWMCADSLDMTKNDKLKAILNEYFDAQSENGEEENQTLIEEQEPIPEYSRGQVLTDIHQFISLYGQEHALTGRAIARVFHGIASPCYPAQTWGRVRRFWRSHLNIDFNELMKMATREVITLRR